METESLKFGLKLTTIDKINGVFRLHPEIEKVVIYGSRAKGNYRPGSDIDITLFGENVTRDTLSKLDWEIDDLNTPYLFDISIYTKLNAPSLQEHIDRVGQVFYTKEIHNS
jgi:predicted nucleotidyltransferase